MRFHTGLEYVAEQLADRELYRRYLREIDVRAVLTYYGATNVEQVGDEIVHSCLLDRVDRHHAHADANPSALANVESKLYLCRTTWGGNILQFVMRMERCSSFAAIVPVLSAIMSGHTTDRPRDFAGELRALLTAPDPPAPLPHYSERALRGWAHVHPYVGERGVSMRAASRLRIGYDPVAVRIVFPHWVGGQLVGWQKRRLDDPRWPCTPPDEITDPKTGKTRVTRPKYKNSQGFPKHSTLYNLDRVLARGASTVVVVESPMSVAVAETLTTGDDLLAATVATFGAKMPAEQVALLRRFTEVIVYMDDDGAGRWAVQRLTAGLHRHTVVRVVTPEPGRDLGDYGSARAVRALLDAATPAALVMTREERAWART